MLKYKPVLPSFKKLIFFSHGVKRDILLKSKIFVSYRKLVFFATALTGFAALCAQVVWQKQLAILVGSEAKSLSLTVAVFLFGLASGYYAFGKLTEKKWKRFLLLKIYGYTELLTALYIGVFPIYFLLLREFSFQSPPHFLSDILVSFLALFLPTFLMGASLPLLTATLPERAEETGQIHAYIYGWNAFGAFLGALFSGFLLIPVFGFPITLSTAAGINLLAALVFIGNKLKGDISDKPDHFVPPASLTPNRAYMVFVFLTGAVVISFEILFVRLLNLSMGSGTYNFPMVLALFVGSLAWGNLSIRNHQISMGFFIRQIFINVFCLGLVYLTAPYWSIWFNQIRVSLHSIPSNYYIYKVISFLFLALFIVPSVFFLGRLLPLSYGLLKKTKENYGSICGFLYFFNTLGTVFGTIVIGYFAFYIFNLDDLFKINLFILISLGFVVSLFERKKLFMTVSLLCAFFLTMVFPPWDRTGHYMGYFRDKLPGSWHFQGLFHLPDLRIKHKTILYFKDGPNTTVTLLAPKKPENKQEEKTTTAPSERDINPPSSDFQRDFNTWREGKNSNYSVIVNGKSDGDTKGDFSTVTLLGTLAYLFAPDGDTISSAVIGLGTGVTAGIMGLLEDMKEIKVLEISPKVIKGIRKISALNYYNFQVTSNPKVKIIQQDAFKYFAKNRKPFDIIVSEPSNPWVVGVENLFSREFYHMASQSLSSEGVLVQWLHTYSMNQRALGMVVKTIREEFPYIQLYQIQRSDLAILAGRSPLTMKKIKRFQEPILQTIHNSLGLHHLSDISLLQIFGSERLASISRLMSLNFLHTLEIPKLTYEADRAFFMGQEVNVYQIEPDYFMDDKKTEEKKLKAFEKYTGQKEKTIEKQCYQFVGFNFYCLFLKQAIQYRKSFEEKETPLLQRLQSYNFLRKRGLLKYQPFFLEEIRTALLEKKVESNQILMPYITHLLSQKEFQKAKADLTLLKEKKILPESFFNSIKNMIEKAEKK